MMDFWPEHQGQSPLYAKFGTVPGRNCTHNYHDRHQATHYPLYYGEQQDQGRESSYWTLPGSRTGGAPQDYANWTDPELPAPASSHFPFILDRHTQQHQDLGEPHEARGREWTAAQRAAREYERGFLREGWQRRWEPCSPVRYNREVPTKRSDSSYRELEAWAARYSHSLPRRRRIEAELRGASQGLLESSRAPERDSMSGTDPQVAALQQARQSASIREPGMWDRGGRQQTLTYYQPQASAPDTSHMLDIKEKTGYQRRIFSQPPGYIAPPPYNSPHKSTPVMHHCDSSWEQEGKRQTYWSQSALRKQDVSVELQDKRRGEKEDFTNPDETKICAELDGLKHRGPETDASQAGSPTSVQNTDMQSECMLSLQQPQTIQAVQNTKTSEQTSSKVIEGRKFRLNKKTGGMTIFCLVSRIAGTTETPSLPLCTSQTNIQSTELGGVSKDLKDSGDISQTQKLADEVDFREPALMEQPNTSDARNLKANDKETPTCVESEILGDNLSNKEGVVSLEITNLDDAVSTFGRQVAQSVQPMSVKYPLWKEPSVTSRSETENSSTLLKANSEEAESDGTHNREEHTAVHPINVEVRRLEIKKDTQSEDSKGLLVIDTTCVVVKMELIPSPKKEHVHYLGSTLQTPEPTDIQLSAPPQSSSQLNQDVIPNPETNLLQTNHMLETEPDTDLGEKSAPEGGGDVSFPCIPSSSISERETLEERAERILGIPLHDSIPEQQPEDTTSFLDSCVEKQSEEVEPSSVTNGIHDATEELPEDTTEEERSQNHVEIGQTEDAVLLKENDEAEDQVKNENGDPFDGPQEQVSEKEKDHDSQLKTDIKMSQEAKMAEDNLVKPTSKEGTTEQSQEENQPVENNTEEDLDPQLAALDTAKNLAPHPKSSSLLDTPSQQLPSPLPPGSTESSPSSTPHTHHSPSPLPPPSPPPPPLDLIDQMENAMSSIDAQDEEGEKAQLISSEISDAFEDQEVVSQQKFEYEQPDKAACAEESNITDEQQTTERDPTDLLEQTLEISKANAIDVNILQQQLECVQAEDVTCVKESYLTEEKLQQEAHEVPAELLETTISQENMTNGQTQVEVKILPQVDDSQEEDATGVKESNMTEEQSQKESSEDTSHSVQNSEISKEIVSDSEAQIKISQQQLYYGQEEDASCVRDSYMTEEQSQIDAEKDPAGLVEQTMSQENAADCQTQREIEILKSTEPQTEPSASPTPSSSDSDCEVSQSPLDVLTPCELPSRPHKSDTEPVPFLEMDTGDVDIPETVPLPLQLYSCEESLQFPSSSTFESAPDLTPNISTPLREGGEGISLELPEKEEPQYPKSLWDAVNRIRKHTAPDSENEEEEISEQWDPESLGEGLSCPDVLLDMNSERIVFDEAGQHEVSTESVEDVEHGPCHEEPSKHVEEDTLSCSSISSHSSGDTVIVAEEDEVEESSPDAVTENKTEAGEEIPAAEGKRCCSGEVKDETAAKEDGEGELDEGDTKEFCLSEECTVEVENITAEATEMTETEQRKNEDGGFTPSEVTVVSGEATGADYTLAQYV